MKLLAFVLLLTVNITSFSQGNETEPCKGQIDSLTNLEVLKIAEQMPEVEGGTQALSKAISKKLVVPRMREHPIESKVIIAFVVDKDGQIKGQRIIRNIAGTDIAAQLLKIVSSLTWKPGTCNNKPVATMKVIPITIDLTVDVD